MSGKRQDGITKKVIKCQHKKWIIDENNLGHCACGATKQFPIEKQQKLRKSEILTMDNLAKDSLYNPDSPINAKIYGIFEENY
jgi:hypothetical protein